MAAEGSLSGPGRSGSEAEAVAAAEGGGGGGLARRGGGRAGWAAEAARRENAASTPQMPSSSSSLALALALSSSSPLCAPFARGIADGWLSTLRSWPASQRAQTRRDDGASIRAVVDAAVVDAADVDKGKAPALCGASCIIGPPQLGQPSEVRR